MKTGNGFKEERAMNEVFYTNPMQQRLGLGKLLDERSFKGAWR